MPNVYSVSGVKCYRKYSIRAKTWKFIPVKIWREMTSAERSLYNDHSTIQIQAVLSGRFGFAK